MATKPVQSSTFTIEKEKDSSINFKSIITKYLYHWPIFLGTVILVMLIALIYLQLTEPVYEIKATLLINQNKNPEFQQQSILDKIDLPNSSDIIENEIAKLKSSKIINQVINDLQLSTSYKIKKGWFYQDLYTSVPFKFILIKSNEDSNNNGQQTIKIRIKDNNSFFLENLDGKFEEHLYKTTINSDLGTWKLEPTSDINYFKKSVIKVTVLDPEKLSILYRKKIDVALEDKLSSAIDLSISDNIKKRGKDILNHLIYVYNNDEILEKNKETQSTLNFIDQRLASLTGELNNAEKNIENFKSSNKITDIASDSKFNLDNLQSNNSHLNDINVQLSIIEGIDKYINSPQNNGKAPAAIGIADAALVSLINKLSQLQLEREQLLATTPETNPDFDQINRQILTTKTAIKENVQNIKLSLINAREKLQSVNSHFESSITNIPSQERQYISIKRQQSIKENLYTYLLQKREEVSLSYASTIKNYRVLDNAYTGPVKWPIKPIVYLIALLLGILLPAFIIYTKDYINNVVINPEEIESEIEMPIISELAYTPYSSPIVISNKSTNLISEQFRTLRTKLYNLHNDGEKSRVTLVTSSVAGEGKSFVSSNISVVLASTGRKTIILELDLRKPKIAKNLNLSKEHYGITDFLMEKAKINEIIQPSNLLPSLDIITSGSIVSNPSELLENGQLYNLILSLKNIYDDIIIDSPPIHLVTDAIILSRFSDNILYIVRQGFTKKSELKFIKNLQKQNNTSTINIIFNGINNKKYGYGYDYDNVYYIAT